MWTHADTIRRLIADRRKIGALGYTEMIFGIVAFAIVLGFLERVL